MVALTLTEDERTFLLKATKDDLERFQAEEETVLDGMPPGFIKGEKLYEEFLKGLIKKLER